MLKIFGSPVSIKVNKVRFVANYLGLDSELVTLNPMAGDLQSEDFLKINPIGKMPAIVDGDFCLSESGAIIRYLASKANSDIYPTDPKQRAVIDQWIDFGSMHVGASFIKVFFNLAFAEKIGMEKDQRSMEEGKAWLLDRFLPILEKRLSENIFLTGAQFSLADLNLLAYLDLAEPANIDLTVYPSLSAWLTNLRSKKFYLKCHKNFEENLAALSA